jgi:hypothetical protein
METHFSDDDKLALVLAHFREFLLEAWPTMQKVLQNHDWDGDIYFLEEWIDQNWSLLVGRQLLGKGANMQPFCFATNDIDKGKYQTCIRAVEPIEGTFLSIGTSGNGFSLAPPFDKVRILKDDGVDEILPFSSVSFRLRVTPPPPDSPP